jgi:hypothetical protein
LRSDYQTPAILLCPDDAVNAATVGTDSNNYPMDCVPRSYMINGWNDFFQQNYSDADFQTYLNSGISPLAIKDTAISHPSETVMFGEKRTDSGQFYMDLFEGAGNDLTELELGRHSNGVGGKIHTGTIGSGIGSGGSNHAMVDGSARFIKYGLALAPVNLWAVTDAGRTNTIAY